MGDGGREVGGGGGGGGGGGRERKEEGGEHGERAGVGPLQVVDEDHEGVVVRGNGGHKLDKYLFESVIKIS